MLKRVHDIKIFPCSTIQCFLGTDKKLAIVLEGESLLNDGAALVFFTVFLQMARGEYQHQDDGKLSFVLLSKV